MYVLAAAVGGRSNVAWNQRTLSSKTRQIVIFFSRSAYKKNAGILWQEKFHYHMILCYYGQYFNVKEYRYTARHALLIFLTSFYSPQIRSTDVTSFFNSWDFLIAKNRTENSELKSTFQVKFTFTRKWDWSVRKNVATWNLWLNISETEVILYWKAPLEAWVFRWNIGLMYLLSKSLLTLIREVEYLILEQISIDSFIPFYKKFAFFSQSKKFERLFKLIHSHEINYANQNKTRRQVTPLFCFIDRTIITE